MKRFLLTITLVSAFIFSTASLAESVSIPISSKTSADATFLKGEPGKPAVLLLHGFLTTNQFATIQSTASFLHSEGYTVIAPNLTLGISKRQKTINCKAVHTHTLENDIEEIHLWYQWLLKKGYQNIIMVGHSSGSQEILAAFNHYSFDQTSAIIYTSLYYINGSELGTKAKDLEVAQSLIDTNSKELRTYSFLFCRNNYNSSPESFLSYHKITRNYVQNGLKNTPKPTYVIMGGKDNRYKKVGRNWLTEIEETGVSLIVIDEANHFFSSDTEFDLQDTILSIVEKHQ